MPNNEWGDFQTPLQLADRAIKSLGKPRWKRVLEPTCGTGSFLTASQQLGPVERFGIEVQPQYIHAATSAGFSVLPRNIFDLNLGTDVPWQSGGPLLVVGNPPWVTNAQLGALGSINLPAKSNIRNLTGFDAMTGASNFDIAEFIFLKLMLELEAEAPTISMLVKTQVARNVLSYASQFQLPYSNFTVRAIDAKANFGANVDACLFTVEHSVEPEYTCSVFPSIESDGPSRAIGVVNGRLVADVEHYKQTSFAEGNSPVEWRSGVKHDASSVMELTLERRNELNLEDDYVLPLLKCTDVFRGRLEPKRFMVIPQRYFGEDTARLQEDAPTLWSYLQSNSETLDGRGSSIYKNVPRFSVFGFGEYTFAPYKIAISGLHKEVRFVLLGRAAGKPIVLDDACYALSFQDGLEAAMCFALLTGPIVTNLLDSLIFWDSKRPVSKKLLQRIDLLAVSREVPLSELQESASKAASTLGLASPADWEPVLTRLQTAWETPTPKTRMRRTARQAAAV